MVTLTWHRLLFIALLSNILSCLRTAEAALYTDSYPAPPFSANIIDAVPTIAIIGTAKGGTTDLYEQLADQNVNSHPDRREPRVLRGPQKETNFLGFEDTDPVKIAPRLREYLGRLGHPCSNHSEDQLRDCVHTAGSNLTTVDATPTYVYVPTVPVQLAVLSPSTKVMVMLRDPVQRVEILFRHLIVDQGMYKDKTIDAVTDSFFAFLQANPDLRQTLRRLSNTSDVAALAAGWREVTSGAAPGGGLLGDPERQLFAGGLYRYALAVWRQAFFKSGRCLVIDSHEYYRDRAAVMEEVIYFLHGRAMAPAERALAGKKAFWRKGTPALSRAGTNWMLSPPQRARLHAFYRRHVLRGMRGMLTEMNNKEGAWIVGFQGPYWTQYEQRRADEGQRAP